MCVCVCVYGIDLCVALCLLSRSFSLGAFSACMDSHTHTEKVVIDRSVCVCAKIQLAQLDKLLYIYICHFYAATQYTLQSSQVTQILLSSTHNELTFWPNFSHHRPHACARAFRSINKIHEINAQRERERRTRHIALECVCVCAHTRARALRNQQLA